MLRNLSTVIKTGKRKILSTITAVAVMLTSVPITTIPVSAASYTSITTDTTFADGDTLDSTTITDAVITVPTGATVAVTGTVTIGGEVTFTGGGTIMRANSFTNDSMVNVPAGATLNLGKSDGTSGITIDGKDITVTFSAEKEYGGAGIRSTGTLNMYDGAVVKNNKLVHSAVNALNMFNAGAGVFVSAGTFNMYDGLITKNNVQSALSGTGGGGVYIGGSGTIDGSGIGTGGTVFNMSGGVISDNSTGSLGGGVYLRGSQQSDSLTLTYVDMNMTGGVISGNFANRYGGAIELLENAHLNMSGGKIIGNAVGIAGKTYGGGVEIDVRSKAETYVNRGLHISGDAEFSGNYVKGGTSDGKQNNILAYNYQDMKLTGNFTGSCGYFLSSGNTLGASFATTANAAYTGANNILLDNVISGGYVGAVSGNNLVWAASSGSLTTPLTTNFTAPKVGDTVSVEVQPVAAAASYQWYRSVAGNSSDTSDWIAIPGANSDSYTATADDLSSYLVCVLNGKEGYSGQQTVVTAAAVTTVAPGGSPIFDDGFGTADCTFATYTPEYSMYSGYRFMGWETAEGVALASAGDAVGGTTYYAKWIDTESGRRVVTTPLDFTAVAPPTLPANTGITWDAVTSTLTLKGAVIDCRMVSDTPYAIKVPAGTTIIADETDIASASSLSRIYSGCGTYDAAV